MDEKIYKMKRFEDYGITKSGKVYSFLTDKFLKYDTSCRGYCKVKLMDRILGKFITCQVHRLVAVQFIKNPYNLPEVNHKDGNHANNSVYNLEWCTREYNQRHALETNLYKIEEDSPRAKLTKDQVLEIYKLAAQEKNKRKIAKIYNVSDSLIGEIIRGVRWSKTFQEYYGYKPTYVKPKRKRIKEEDIYNILYKYYVAKESILSIEREFNISNGYISKLVRGLYHPTIVNKCLLEIKQTLDNQQPSPNDFRKGSTTKQASSQREGDIV